MSRYVDKTELAKRSGTDREKYLLGIIDMLTNKLDNIQRILEDND